MWDVLLFRVLLFVLLFHDSLSLNTRCIRNCGFLCLVWVLVRWLGSVLLFCPFFPLAPAVFFRWSLWRGAVGFLAFAGRFWSPSGSSSPLTRGLSLRSESVLYGIYIFYCVTSVLQSWTLVYICRPFNFLMTVSKRTNAQSGFD